MERVGQEQGAEQGAGGIGQQERSYSRSGAEVLSCHQGDGVEQGSWVRDRVTKPEILTFED
jgi:hypothetical protein